MSRLLSYLVTLTWGLWIGGIGGVTLAVIALSKTYAPGTTAVLAPGSPSGSASDAVDVFGTVAPAVFALFERFQLGFAAAALILTFGWRLCRGAAGLKTTLFALFAVATVAAVVETAVIAPKMNHLRAEKLTKSPEFEQAHRMSERLYGGTLLVLAGAGAVLITAVGRESVGRARTLDALDA
ncbi:MAG TPA: hypothetical protein VF796_01675 [Humisphaera sp.]